MCIYWCWQIQHNFKNEMGGYMLSCFAFATTIAHTANSTIHSGKWSVFLTGKALNAVSGRASIKSSVDCVTMFANALDHFLGHDIPHSFPCAFHPLVETLNQTIETPLLVFESLYMKNTREQMEKARCFPANV